jgi:hypothetical protein
MSSKLTLTIKDYHNGGGDLELKITSSGTSERVFNGTRIIKLTVTRKPDQHSSRLGMFAYLRNNQPVYQSLGFPQATVTFDKYSDDDGTFISKTLIDYFDVFVDKVAAKGNEEEITFRVRSKSGEFTISNVVAIP